MKIETKYGSVLLDHCQKNINGMYLYNDVIQSVMIQAPDLFKKISIVQDILWISESDILQLARNPEKEQDNIDEQTRKKYDVALESNKIYCYFNENLLGRMFDTGLTSSLPISNAISFKELINTITKNINKIDLNVQDRDYYSACRMALISSKKQANDTVYLANKKGLSNAA